TPKKYLDEVAFQLTYLPAEVLTHSTFNQAADWNVLLTNAELIYTHADSLKYVRIKEYGDTNTKDWYTTTEYKIKQGSSYIWREVDRYYYYMFIVMPKLYDEALMVRDITSYYDQRTWGYFWRDFLWNNPSSAHNYKNVNMCGYPMLPSGNRDSVCIDTIHRLGQLMQMPEYLWDERPTYWNFNRSYSASQSALDVLGNWCSRCIPWDVTSTSQMRSSQPNQIAINHYGNCHEDAILVTSAARTALIPCMHISDNCDDHVWAAIHDGGDSVWHHYEFFRGGLSAGWPYYWGMTNMQADGGYGWKSSFVYGEVPDGNYINVSKTYSDDTAACRLKLTIKGRDGKPVDGARINLYSTNYQHGSTPYILSAGYVWTDANGQVDLVVGTGNKYYMKVYHPKFGSFPSTTGQVYLVYATANTTAGRTYSKTYTFDTTLTPVRNNVTYDQTEYPATHSVSIVAKADNVNTGVRPSDCQGGRFYQRTNTLGNVSIYVVDENNINRFRNGDMTGNAEFFFGKLSEGQIDVPVHTSGRTYVVLTNNNNFTNYVELNYGYEMKEGAVFDPISLQNAEKANFTVYPNPATDQVVVSVEGAVENGASVEILDMSGRLVAKQAVDGQSAVINVGNLQNGVYVVKYGGSVRKIIKK
ncbi:MAG: T9SS type A sorting domain-containing protein, partial [Bacteroidales bacterium]|nr:T9SS type A sorting domain-containing protein [Bacteroidales bacterium]